LRIVATNIYNNVSARFRLRAWRARLARLLLQDHAVL